MPTPSEGLQQFYDLIWGSIEGFVYIPVAHGKGRDKVWQRNFFRWPEDKANVVRYTLAMSARERDVYFSPVLWKEPKLGNKDNILCSGVIWADFDGNIPDWYPSSGSDGPIQAPDGQPGAVPGPPSIIIQSSTEDHQHVYWKLDDSISSVNQIENINRAIAYSYGADTSGWDAEQILRPPFTTNFKHNIPVLLSSADATNYSIDQFTGFAPVKQLVSDAIDEKNLPLLEKVLAKYNWGVDNLQIFEKDVPVGIRSAYLMRLGYRGAELGATDEEIYSVLIGADDRVGKFKYRNDRKKRLLDIINHARQKFPHAVEEFNGAGLLGATAGKTDSVSLKTIYTFGEFVAADFNVDWAIDNLMPKGGLGLVSSAPGIGKTQWLVQAGIHQSLGRDFCGYRYPGKAKGIFFSLEMGAHGFHRLSATISAGYNGSELSEISSQFLVVPAGEPIPLNSGPGAQYFEALLDEHRPEWVAIDSLQKVVGKMDDDGARALFNYLARIRAKYGCYLWLVHHNRKAQVNNAKPNKLEDIYGSIYITAEPDVVLTLWRDSPTSKQIEFSELKSRYSEIRPPFVIERDEHLNFHRVDSSLEGMVQSATRLDARLGDTPREGGNSPPGTNPFV